MRRGDESIIRWVATEGKEYLEYALPSDRPVTVIVPSEPDSDDHHCNGAKKVSGRHH